MESVAIKTEIPAEDYILIEDEVKIEETCLQGPPTSVIIEERLSVCSMCKCGFQRGTSVKFWHESDLYKCNKCILHSRLSQVFKSKFLVTKRKGGKYPGTKWKKRKKQPVLEDDSSRDSDVVIVESKEEAINSIFVTRVLYVCSICKVKFERSDTVGLKEASDWSKCNKCILHGRLNSIFTPATKRKNLVK